MARRSPLRAFAALVVLTLTGAIATPATAQLCAPGNVSATGSEPCTACSAGSFQSSSGQTTCPGCDVGTFTDAPGQSSCASCSAGTFQAASGQSSCTSCGVGTFQAASGASTCQSCNPGTANSSVGAASCPACNAGTFTNALGQTSCASCSAGTFQAASGQTSCTSCGAGTFQNMAGQTSCEACTTCSAGFFVSAVCTASSDAACSACDPSCATCTGPGANQCSTCPSGEQLVGGACQSLCGTAPNPVCLVAAQAQLQSNDAHTGKETLKLRWAKITTATMRASFGDPVGGSTVAAFCLFNDAGTPVGELIVDRAGKTCGTKPCWRLTGKQGLAYKDKTASADGVIKIGFVGAAAGKGKASAQGKNNASQGLTSLPRGISAALTGNTSPTIELVTSNGFCVGATMNRVVKDEALQYKAQKK